MSYENKDVRGQTEPVERLEKDEAIILGVAVAAFCLSMFSLFVTIMVAFRVCG